MAANAIQARDQGKLPRVLRAVAGGHTLPSCQQQNTGKLQLQRGNLARKLHKLEGGLYNHILYTQLPSWDREPSSVAPS